MVAVQWGMCKVLGILKNKKGDNMKKTFLVIDAPAEATPEEIEALLNKPIEDGYYLQRLQPKTADTAVRAFFQLRTRAARQ
jgi:hypothetical protein